MIVDLDRKIDEAFFLVHLPSTGLLTRETQFREDIDDLSKIGSQIAGARIEPNLPSLEK